MAPPSPLIFQQHIGLDMDMDLGWCLTCAKRTHDARSPYCSDACRRSDTAPSTPPADTHGITSPLPPNFVPLPNVDRRRPDVSPLAGHRCPMVSESIVQPAESERVYRQRDRRAFSFPASDGNDGERTALPFARKAKAVNNMSRSFKRVHGSADVSKQSTGTNTPIFEATFDSTSSSEQEDTVAHETATRSPLTALSGLHPAPPMPMSRLSSNGVVPVSQATSMSSPLHTARPSLETRPATSPISRMGSSSRSRDDIISWARGVDSGASMNGDSDDDSNTRGRRRGRRPNALAHLSPPSTEPLDEPEPTASTPRSGTAFGALSFTPVVNALRRVSLAPEIAPAESALGLVPNPAPAEVSRVDVLVATRAPEADVFDCGGTPSLSTMSFSEAVDQATTTDMGETIESATDDFSVISSIDRRQSYSPRVTKPPLPAAVAAQNRRRSSLGPLRPIQTTASALWSFSSYLRSLSPFTVPPFVSPFTPITEPLKTPALETEPLPSPRMPSSPLPALGKSPLTPEEPETPDLVRSVPMDIVINAKAQALTEERQREREAMELLARPDPKRTEASRSPSPVPGERSRSQRGSTSPAREADRSGDERRSRGRGRPDASRRESNDRERGERRGRRRDRVAESRERDWSVSPGRGRRAASRAVAV